MTAYFSRPEITTRKQVLSHLKAEYHQMTFYASREVILAVRKFIGKPSQETFASVLLANEKRFMGQKAGLERCRNQTCELRATKV